MPPRLGEDPQDQSSNLQSFTGTSSDAQQQASNSDNSVAASLSDDTFAMPQGTDYSFPSVSQATQSEGRDSEVFAQPPRQGDAWDVAIVGSGPAGLTAAIYSTRGAASTIVVGGENWGGQLMLTTDVDNFPGFPKGIKGPELMTNMRIQAERFGTEFVEENAVDISLSKRPKEIKTSGGKTILAKVVIIATGAETRWLGVPGEDKLRGRGVSSCAPCDAPFFKGKRVVVIGGGDAAMEEALVLVKYADKVTIIHRREEFRASAAMQNKVFDAQKAGKIDILWNREVVEFVGANFLEKVILKDVKTNELSEFSTQGAFVAIGHTPATSLFSKEVEVDEKGYVKRIERNGFHMSTNIDGVFVAGDVHDSHYQQAITAAGMGCMAAMDALKYLDEYNQPNQ
jgi:thioredoxin reductase (NADPH)